MTGFPEVVALNGADNFMLVLDAEMLQGSVAGNTCHLAVQIDEIAPEQLKKQIENDAGIVWLSNLRLTRRLFGLCPSWRRSLAEIRPIVRLCGELQQDDIAPMLGGMRIDPHLENALRFTIHKTARGALLIMSFHHALFDARGAEFLLAALGSGKALSAEALLGSAQPKPARFWDARRSARFLFKLAQGGLAKALQTGPRKQGITGYRQLMFTAEESAAIDCCASENGAHFVRSSYYLAIISSALTALPAFSGSAGKAHFVPMPHDQRKRGKVSPVVQNQLSFIYLKVRPQAALRACISDLQRQMQDFLRNNLDQAFLNFMQLGRCLPLALYRNLLRRPAQGVLASFCFSNTGDAARHLSRFLDYPVREVLHYPPLLHPPGLVCNVSHFQGRLAINLAYAADIHSAADIARFEKTVRGMLLGGRCDLRGVANA